MLDTDLDPEPLAVEAVLVALVEAVQRLVALEDVLQGAAPRVVDAHRVVRGDRPVEEAEPLVSAVLLAQALEGSLALPALEQLAFESRMVGYVWEWREDLRHESIVPSGNKVSRPRVWTLELPRKKGFHGRPGQNRRLRERGAPERAAGARGLLGRVVRPVPRDRAGARPDRRGALRPEGREAEHRRGADGRAALRRDVDSDADPVQG